jgi:phenylpropionate dioxygenase-like ring-hydroxylating dioxygenase large terminal subunit
MAADAGWFPVAPAADVGARPLQVGAGGRGYVLVRLRPGAEVTAFPARCSHRLVPLATGAVVDGRLQCPYHGWRFDSEGRCADIPSLGAGGTPPPRADLAMPWAVEELHGWVWLAPEPTSSPLPPRPAGTPSPEPVPAPPAPGGPVFTNLDPALEHAWHPVALSSELQPGGWLQVRLLGRTWMLHREGSALTADPPAFGVRERFGVIWLAPAEPADVPLEVPEARDRRFVPGWMLPVRSPGPAGLLADTFLDATHGAFVHASTLGAGDAAEGHAYEVTIEPGGFTSAQEQRRRRTTYTYRAPFQLRLRQESLDAGTTTTLLYLLQPEDLDSTRIYVCLLLSDGPGRPLPRPVRVAGQLALQKQILEEDVRSQATLALDGLPLDGRDEVHVPADARAVALRRALCDFIAAGQRQLVA